MLHLHGCGGRTNGPSTESDAKDESGTDAANDVGERDGSPRPESSVDAEVAPPSCAPGGPGMTNCGPGGSGTESCCTSLEVSGDEYYRTYDQVFGDASISFPINIPPAADGGPVDEAYPATVSTFRLDKYLVTVGRFRQFMNAIPPPDGGPGWLPSAGSGKHIHLNGGQGLANSGTAGGYEPGWAVTDDIYIAPTSYSLTVSATWTASAGSNENLPINNVNWYQAYAFCIWDGGFLPSEAEWEYAAAGGSQQREYPWGTTAPGTINQYAIYECYYPSGTGICSSLPQVAQLAPVGTTRQGAGLWGQLDLAGDLFEWNLDWYDDYTGGCTDCANLTNAKELTSRVDRGGSYYSGSSYLLAPVRNTDAPSGGDYYLGFRCARAP